MLSSIQRQRLYCFRHDVKQHITFKSHIFELFVSQERRAHETFTAMGSLNYCWDRWPVLAYFRSLLATFNTVKDKALPPTGE